MLNNAFLIYVWVYLLSEGWRMVPLIKILGLINFSSDLKILTAFRKSLVYSAFILVSDFQIRVMASQQVLDFTINFATPSMVWLFGVFGVT